MQGTFSPNLMAYLLCHGVDFDDCELLESDRKKGEYYMQIRYDISELKEQYKNDEELHRFLGAYKFVRNEMNKKRYGK